MSNTFGVIFVIFAPMLISLLAVVCVDRELRKDYENAIELFYMRQESMRNHPTNKNWN